MKKRNLNIYVFTTVFVIKNQSPILYVYHDEDGDWQFLGIEDHLTDADSMIISLGEILEHDPTLTSILDLPKSKQATRSKVGKEWIINDI